MTKRIFVAGHTGMVGSAIVRRLIKNGALPQQVVTRLRSEVDLTNRSVVESFFSHEKFDEVYLAAAKVGGIHANDTYPADFIRENLLIQTNVIDLAFTAGVRKLLFLGSSCIYPRSAQQPMSEDSLLTGPLEPTNAPYAIAKIAGVIMCESYNRQFGVSHGTDFRSVMPTNLYGPGDNYHPENSHVIPALIRRFHEAKVNSLPSVGIWGTGRALREFLHVDDLADACCHIMNLEKTRYLNEGAEGSSHINVGYGDEITIKELAEMIAEVTDYRGSIMFDHTKPDGTPRKLLDSSRVRSMGWQPSIALRDGLKATYQDFLCNNKDIDKRPVSCSEEA